MLFATCSNGRKDEFLPQTVHFCVNGDGAAGAGQDGHIPLFVLQQLPDITFRTFAENLLEKHIPHLIIGAMVPDLAYQFIFCHKITSFLF